MRGGFWADVWRSFRAIYGPVLTTAGVAGTLAAFFIAPGASVTMGWKWLILVMVLVGVAAFTILDMLSAARRLAQARPPRVISAVASGLDGNPEAGPLILVLDVSALFGNDVLVSIYLNEQLANASDLGFERLIGVGRVFNIQGNGLIQIAVLAELPEQAGVWRRIRGREVSVLREVLVKPSVSREGLALVRGTDAL